MRTTLAKSKRTKLAKSKWSMTNGRNMILEYPTFYISWNRDTGESARYSPLGFLQDLGECLGMDEAQAETALVKDHHFSILNGDFRKEYEALGDDYEACLKLFKRLEKKHGSKWTTGSIL